jgi:hypothetical protein
MTQFSLSRVAPTGLVQPELAPADGAPRTKMRKLSEILLEVPRPRPQVKRQLQEKTDVQVCIYKITDDARLVWNDVKESDYTLWQVQVQHQAQDDITVNLYNSFNEFLKTHESTEIPKSLVELQQKALIKLVITDKKDPDGAECFVQWRPAFYVAGDESALHNVLYLLDEYWTYKCKDKSYYVNVSMHPHFGVDIAECKENFVHPHCLVAEPSKKLPMGFFEAHPVQGRKILQMTVQIDSESVLSIALSGPIWNLRDGFEAMGIAGFKHENDVYYRVLPNLDASKEETKDLVRQIFGLLRNLAARVVVEGQAKPTTPVHGFLAFLRDFPHLHFA